MPVIGIVITNTLDNNNTYQLSYQRHKITAAVAAWTNYKLSIFNDIFWIFYVLYLKSSFGFMATSEILLITWACVTSHIDEQIKTMYMEVNIRPSSTKFSGRRVLPPFLLDGPGWNSFSSTFTETLLYFMRQKKERRAPEPSLVAPAGRSAGTCSPAGEKQQTPGSGLESLEPEPGGPSRTTRYPTVRRTNTQTTYF